MEVKYGINTSERVTASERISRIETEFKSQLTRQENLPFAKKVERGTDADFLIVYGQGPVMKGNLRVGKETQGDVNVYCRLNAVAAAAMYREGMTTKIILTGGQTGGKELRSEGELMKDIMVNEYGIPEEVILVEDKAGNTLQNYANSLVMEGGIRDDSRVVHLAAPHHTGRVHMMAKMFGLDGSTFSSEQILRQVFDRAIRGEDYNDNLIGFNSEDSRAMAQNMHILFNADDNPNFFARATAENRWTEGLIRMPEYWIMQAAMVTDQKRFFTILQNLNNIDRVLIEGVHPLGVELNYRQKIMSFCEQEGIDLSGIDFDTYANNDPQKLQQLMGKFRTVKRDLAPKTWDSIYGGEYWRYEKPEEWLPRALNDIDFVVSGLEGKTPANYRPQLLQGLFLPAKEWFHDKGIEIQDID